MAENIGAIEYEVRAEVGALVNSAKQVDSAASAMESSLKGADAQAKVLGTTMTKTAQAVKMSTGQMHMMRGGVSQLGYQIQDIAVQLGMGTNAMLVFGQQGSQIASIFGPGGAVLGAILAITSAIGVGLVGAMASASKEIDILNDKVSELTSNQKAFTSIKINEALDDYSESAATLKQRIATLNNYQSMHGKLTEGQSKDLAELLADYDLLQGKITTYKDRLAELNGGPSKDAKKAHDDITQSIGLEIEALEKGDRAAAISAAMQKLGATATKQQRDEVTALINKYYDLKAAQEAQQESQKAQTKSSNAAQKEFDANSARLANMAQQLQIAGLSTQGLERDAAMLAAEFSLGASATQAQIDKIREMAGSIYDLKEAERQREEQKQKSKQAEQFVTGVEMDAMNPLQRIDAEEQAKLAKLEEYRTADALSLQAYEDAKTAITTKAANDRVAYERQVSSMLLSSSADMFGGMADLAKTFGGEQSGAYKAMFAVSKGFAVANAALQLQTAIANAMALPFPANLPAIGQAVALGGQVASSIAGVSYGGGRRYGGPVNPGSMYQVNESGNPEMMIAGGKQYLLPNSRGEVIPSDSSTGGAGVQWQIVVNNTAPGVDVQSSVNDETKTVTLAVQEVARQLGSRTGPVAQGLQRGFNVPGRTS